MYKVFRNCPIIKTILFVLSYFCIPFSSLLLTVIDAAYTEPLSSCDLQPKALAIAERIRGLKATREIPCDLRSREEVGKFIRENIATKLPKEKLRREGLVYKALGIVPEDYPYEEGIVNLYMGQIGGYYDPDTRRFVMADWIPSSFQISVAVHELTHALQDQKFVLSKIMDPNLQNGDEVLARAALVEGDASAVMTDYANEVAGIVVPDSERKIGELNVAEIEMAAGQLSEGGIDHPAALRHIVIFPYTFGLRFAETLLKRGGYKELDKAFMRLPRTSEEILHPDIYFSEKQSFAQFSSEHLSEFLVPNSNGLSNPTPIYTDTLGEYAIAAMLNNILHDEKRGNQAAQGWGGDLIGLYEFSANQDLTLVWRTRWDTDIDAKEFFEAYGDCLRKMSGTDHSFKDLSLVSKNRRARVVLQKSDVIVTFTLSPILWNRIKP